MIPVTLANHRLALFLYIIIIIINYMDYRKNTVYPSIIKQMKNINSDSK